jgi:hypothetical protein
LLLVIAGDAAKQAAIDAVQADVDANEIADAAARVVLSTKIDTDVAAEATARSAAISVAITDLIGGAPGALDTLNEIAASIGDDSDFVGTVNTLFADEATARALHQAAYEAADTALSAAIAQETSERQAAIAQFTQDLADEETRALAVEADLAAQASGLSADGTQLSLTTMTTDNLFCETVTVGSMMSGDIPASYTDAATLAAGTNDGMMFYYADVDGASSAPFDEGKKWYFCEGGEWHPSPFYTE